MQKQFFVTVFAAVTVMVASAQTRQHNEPPPPPPPPPSPAVKKMKDVPPPPAPDPCPEPLRKILIKSMAPEPERRYQSAANMLADIALLEDGQSVKRKRAVQKRWALTRKLGIALFALALLAPILSLLRGKPGHAPNAEALALYQEGAWNYGQLTAEQQAELAKRDAERESNPGIALTWDQVRTSVETRP